MVEHVETGEAWYEHGPKSTEGVSLYSDGSFLSRDALSPRRTDGFLLCH